jgi:hypothetical protein
MSENKCVLCGAKEKINSAVRIKNELKPVCYVCLIGVAHATPERGGTDERD